MGNNQISLDVIVTTSYSPHADSIQNLTNTIKSLSLIKDLKNKVLNWRVIIAVDGLNPNYNSNFHRRQFEAFCKKLLKLQDTNIQIALNSQWGHLSGNLQNAFNLFVSNQYVLIVQDDLPFITDVPLKQIIVQMKKYKNLKHIRFNRRANLAAGLDTELISCQFGDMKFLKTDNWSDNNHLCKANYYRILIFPKTKSQSTFPENIMRTLNLQTPEIYGTYIYGKFNKSATIEHTGQIKSRVRAQMNKVGVSNDFARLLITMLLRIHDFLKIFMEKFR